MNNMLKKCLAEFVGTFVLVFFACGTAAYTGGNVVATSLAFGLSIVAMAYSVGRISGAHLNPAVSLGVYLKGVFTKDKESFTFKDFLLYTISQILGATVGAILLSGIFKMADVKLLGDACNNVVGGYANGFTAGNVFGTLLAEIVLTGIFVYVILNVTDSKNNGVGKKGGLIIGLTLTLVHLVGIGLTGTSVNPARSLATAISALIYNGSTAALEQVWLFIIAPLIGTLIAALLFKCFHTSKAEIKVVEEEKEAK